MTKYHRLRLYSDTPAAHTLQVWLDDKELRGVTGVEITASVSDVIRVKIEMVVELGDADMVLPLEIRTKT